jgi:glucokinase
MVRKTAVRSAPKPRATFRHPALLCDIGGTNVRVAEVIAPGAPVNILAHIGTHDSKGLAEALAGIIETRPVRPRSIIVCAAGPVEGRRVTLTNARWTIDGPGVAKQLKLDQGLLLNDFEAQAIMLPSLRARDTKAIGDVRPPRTQAARLVIGPGTGLGAALLLPWQSGMLPVTTEAGHMDFGPASAFEIELWAVIQRSVTRITGEGLLSGPGTMRLYHALCEIEGVKPNVADPADVTALGHEDRKGIEAKTLRLFWHLMARYSGFLALGLLARGGVVLSGGILPKITEFLDVAAFRTAFDDQAPLRHVVEKIPVRLVTAHDGVLRGLAALAADPDRYMIDYSARLWR